MSLKQRLIAIREMSRATVEMVDEVLASMEPPPPSTSTECEHPEDQRVSTAAMGKPNAFWCKACDKEVGG